MSEYSEENIAALNVRWKECEKLIMEMEQLDQQKQAMDLGLYDLYLESYVWLYCEQKHRESSNGFR